MQATGVGFLDWVIYGAMILAGLGLITGFIIYVVYGKTVCPNSIAKSACPSAKAPHHRHKLIYKQKQGCVCCYCGNTFNPLQPSM